MYTRSRQSQGGQQNFNQGQRQMPNQSPVQFQGQANYSQGNYQSTPQKGNYTGNIQNSQQFKPQQQQIKQQQQQTPVKPAMQQQQAKPQIQQQQATQQQLMMQQQQQQQMMQNKPQQQQGQQQGGATPQPQRLKPILKQSGPATPQAANPQQVSTPTQQANPAPTQQIKSDPSPQTNNTETNQTDAPESTEKMDLDGQEQPVRRWKRKAPGLKINRKLKRMRLNQRLRKTLQPKNAIMVLNEMKTGVQFTFPESQASLNSSLFLVHAEIDGKTYVGQGLSKPLARQNAAENALKSLLLEKMTAASMKARMDAESDGQSLNASIDGSDSGANENTDGSQAMDTAEETEEIPWSSLASFALYKLFLEWQNQGTVVPVPRPGVSTTKIKRDHKPIVQKELPPNATTIHPVMLLNQMRPGLTYVESNRVGNPPNTIFTLSVEIDGVEYQGTAKNKRDAKKAAAKAALHSLFNLTFPEDAVKVDNEGEPMMA